MTRLSEDSARAEQAEGLEKLKSLFSPHTGVAQWKEEIMTGTADARMTNMICEMAPRTLTLGSSFPMAAASAHYDRDAALAAALGEAVERYATSYLPKSQFVLATASEIGQQAVTPERFALFHEDQYAQDEFRFEPFTSDTKVCWVKGWSIPDGEEVYLPQQLVYMGYERGAGIPGETQIGTGSSSGVSLGLTREDALVGGLLEVIERDAIMLTWLNSVALPRLAWSSDDEMVEYERRHFAPTGLPYDVIDLSVWCGVPTALAIHVGGEGSIRYAMGGASAPTMQEAWDKAMRELFQGVMLLRFNLAGRPEPSFRDDFSDVMSPEDHSLLYLVPGNESYAAFLTSSEEVRDVGDVPSLEGDGPAAWIESIARRLEAVGASAYAVDVSTPDVKEAGLHVVKAVIPELQPIDFVHMERFVGGRRLYEAAHQLGLRSAPLAAEELNPYPHPFP